MVSVQDIAAYPGLIVTYESADLVDELRRAGLEPPTRLANVMDAQRLCVGVPRDEGGERHWDIWVNLIPHFSNSDDARLFRKGAL